MLGVEILGMDRLETILPQKYQEMVEMLATAFLKPTEKSALTAADKIERDVLVKAFGANATAVLELVKTSKAPQLGIGALETLVRRLLELLPESKTKLDEGKWVPEDK